MKASACELGKLYAQKPLAQQQIVTLLTPCQPFAAPKVEIRSSANQSNPNYKPGPNLLQAESDFRAYDSLGFADHDAILIR